MTKVNFCIWWWKANEGWLSQRTRGLRDRHLLRENSIIGRLSFCKEGELFTAITMKCGTRKLIVVSFSKFFNLVFIKPGICSLHMGLFSEEQIHGKNKKSFFSCVFAISYLISSKKLMKTAVIFVCLSLLMLQVLWWLVLCNTANAAERINATVTGEYFSGETEPTMVDKQPLYSKHAFFWWKFLAIRIYMRDEKAKTS